MQISFSDPNNGRSLEIDTASMEKFIRQEYKERKGDQENPGGYAPSEAFNIRGQQVIDLRAAHTRHLEQKMDQQEAITQNDLHEAKSLERLAIMVGSDPSGNNFRHKEKKLDRGQGVTGQQATFKNIEIRASRAGLIGSGSPRERVQVSPTFG